MPKQTIFKFTAPNLERSTAQHADAGSKIRHILLLSLPLLFSGVLPTADAAVDISLDRLYQEEIVEDNEETFTSMPSITQNDDDDTLPPVIVIPPIQKPPQQAKASPNKIQPQDSELQQKVRLILVNLQNYLADYFEEMEKKSKLAKKQNQSSAGLKKSIQPKSIQQAEATTQVPPMPVTVPITPPIPNAQAQQIPSNSQAEIGGIPPVQTPLHLPSQPVPSNQQAEIGSIPPPQKLPSPSVPLTQQPAPNLTLEKAQDAQGTAPGPSTAAPTQPNNAVTAVPLPPVPPIQPTTNAPKQPNSNNGAQLVLPKYKAIAVANPAATAPKPSLDMKLVLPTYKAIAVANPATIASQPSAEVKLVPPEYKAIAVANPATITPQPKTEMKLVLPKYKAIAVANPPAIAPQPSAEVKLVLPEYKAIAVANPAAIIPEPSDAPKLVLPEYKAIAVVTPPSAPAATQIALQEPAPLSMSSAPSTAVSPQTNPAPAAAVSSPTQTVPAAQTPNNNAAPVPTMPPLKQSNEQALPHTTAIAVAAMPESSAPLKIEPTPPDLIVTTAEQEAIALQEGTENFAQLEAEFTQDLAQASQNPSITENIILPKLDNQPEVLAENKVTLGNSHKMTDISDAVVKADENDLNHRKVFLNLIAINILLFSVVGIVVVLWKKLRLEKITTLLDELRS